ncbi:MAG: CRISPR-associated protein Csx16 [Methylobacter sp.]
MTIYFISRHPGAADWSRQQGIQVDRQLSHLDIDLINPGDTVIGSLPVNLACEVCARNARYIHLCLELPLEARGVELNAEDMERFGVKFEEYKIIKVLL